MSRKPISTSSEIDTNVLDEARKLVANVAEMVGNGPALSAKDRIRSAKLRKGGETIIPTVAALSDQFGVSLASHPTTAMVESAKKAQSLIPLHNQLVQATKQVADQIFSANVESWGAATVHYSTLKRLARTNGDLKALLVPVEQFFAPRSAAVIAEENVKKGTGKAARAKASAATTATTTTPSAPAPVVAGETAATGSPSSSVT